MCREEMCAQYGGSGGKNWEVLDINEREKQKTLAK